MLKSGYSILFAVTALLIDLRKEAIPVILYIVE